MRGAARSNKGYSLVELIIVMAIIAVIGLGTTWSFILVFSANAKTCANDIVSAISECRIMTMTKGEGNVRLIIYRDGANGTIYSELQTRKTATSVWETGKDGREKIGANRCTVGTSKDTDDIPTSRNTAWEIYFNRSTGALMDTTTVSEMHVVGGRKHYYIKIERLTGKTTKQLQ